MITSNLKTKKILSKYNKNKKKLLYNYQKIEVWLIAEILELKNRILNILAFIDSDDIWNKNKLETSN